MKEWRSLYDRHGAMRAVSRDLPSSLHKRLIELARRGHCDMTIRGRFRNRHSGPLHELYIEADGHREPLLEVPHLKNTHLTVLASISRRMDHLHHFTAMIEGTTTAGSPWVVAVHLENDHHPPDHDRKGNGACGHAAFHCHVGPDMDHEPKVRVPFPEVGPVGALDWLLSIVIPSWEPAPWPNIAGAQLR